MNLNHCREYTIEQEPKEDTPESLYPIDINKVNISNKDYFEEEGNCMDLLD